MPKNYFMDTIQNIEKFLSKKPDWSKKLMSSSNPGYIFQEEKDGITYFFDVNIFNSFEHIHINVYPGIKVISEALIPLVAQYCIRYSPDVGNLCVDTDRNEVFYHIDLPICENAMSEITIREIENIVFDTFKEHYTILKDLAEGNLPESLPKIKEKNYVDVDHFFLKELKDSYEIVTGHNAVTVSMNPVSSILFVSEYVINDARMRIVISKTSNPNFIVFRFYDSFGCHVIHKANFRRVAYLCSKKNHAKQSAFLSVDDDLRPCIEAYVAVSDGPVSSITTGKIESMMIMTYVNIKDFINSAVYGIFKSDDADYDEKLDEMLSSFADYGNDDFEYDSLLNKE